MGTLEEEMRGPADLFKYFHNIRPAEIEPRFDRRREAMSLPGST
jgi:hypothetical protein